MVVQNSRAAALLPQMQLCLPMAISWSGTIYRVTPITYANRHDLFSGRGAQIAGGRWNPPNRFRATYASLEPETALAEALGNSREFGIPVSRDMPLVIVAADIRVQCILDLTSDEVARRLGISVRELNSVNWNEAQEQGREALTQGIGRIAWEEGVEGLLVPSARCLGASNIVLFPSRRRPGSSWRIQGVRKLLKRVQP